MGQAIFGRAAKEEAGFGSVRPSGSARPASRPVRLAAAGAVALLALLTPRGFLEAATLIPPHNMGEIVRGSALACEAVAGESWVESRGSALWTVTEMTALRTVAGSASEGETFLVAVPGGSVGDAGWLVDGAPRFTAGGTYFLCLHQDGWGSFEPMMLAYGVLEKITGRAGQPLLAPVPEAAGIEPLARPDGSDVEPVAVYHEGDLLDHLTQVAAGESEWDGQRVAARPEELPRIAHTQDTSYGCPMLGQGTGAGYPVRWNIFDKGKTLTMYTESAGEPTFGPDGGHRQVQAALAAWMGIPGTSLKLKWGGQKTYSMSCTPGSDAPAAGANIVVFGNQCNELPPLTNCAGIAAYGGPYYSGTHTFKNLMWQTAVSWYVMVNAGSACIGEENYVRLLTHELGHGLGFAHSEDPNALMYAYCCNAFDETDTACVRNVYPGGNAGVPAAPQSVIASQGSITGQVDVNWEPVDGATGYEVWRDQGGSVGRATRVGAVASPLFSDVDVQPGMAYTYWVLARNGSASGAFSAAAVGFASCGPASVAALTAPQTALSGSTYEVSWVPVEGASGYVVEESADAGFKAPARSLVSATSASFAHTVSSVETYYYRVTPAIACGSATTDGGYSNVEATTVVASQLAPAPSLLRRSKP